jgi:hypothetical protein
VTGDTELCVSRHLLSVRERSALFYLLTVGSHLVGLSDKSALGFIIWQARGGHRWNSGAKSFVVHLERGSFERLNRPYGHTKQRGGRRRTMAAKIASDFTSRILCRAYEEMLTSAFPVSTSSWDYF